MGSGTISGSLVKSSVSDSTDARTRAGLEAFNLLNNSTKSFQHLKEEGTVIISSST